ncbi:MAG: hypothetical protein SGPRY_000578 [Prymnesium sp.]
MSRSTSEQRLAKQQQIQSQGGKLADMGVQETPLQKQQCSPSRQDEDLDFDDNYVPRASQLAVTHAFATDCQAHATRLRLREFGLIYIAYMGFLIVRRALPVPLDISCMIPVRSVCDPM